MAKQAEDNRTLTLPEMAEPKRRGRQPLGERAMTAAEKQRAYRQRVKAEGKVTTAVEVFRLIELAIELVKEYDQEGNKNSFIPFLAGTIKQHAPELAKKLMALP